MTIATAINDAITSKAKAERLFAELYATYSQCVGSDKAAHADRLSLRSSPYKPHGLAWWKDRCRTVAHSIIDANSRITRFIPPSPETLNWGGFLGGEHICYTNREAEAAAEAKILDHIARL